MWHSTNRIELSAASGHTEDAAGPIATALLHEGWRDSGLHQTKTIWLDLRFERLESRHNLNFNFLWWECRPNICGPSWRRTSEGCHTSAIFIAFIIKIIYFYFYLLYCINFKSNQISSQCQGFKVLVVSQYSLVYGHRKPPLFHKRT